MSEFSALAGNEGYGACADAVASSSPIYSQKDSHPNGVAVFFVIDWKTILETII